MYTLTLTHAERAAITWVGNRYAHGYDLYKLLETECDDCELEWDAPEDVTFNVPEFVAWQILEIADACNNRWDCFSPKLTTKMIRFCMQIV
jgi:hypothetical protein